MVMEGSLTQKQIICLKVWIPMAVVVLIVLEVVFGLMIVTRLPLGLVVSSSVSRWFSMEETVKPTDAPVCSRAVLRPFQSLSTIALVSYPKTGSTWVRQLIERATGIYTGTMYEHEQKNANLVKMFPGNKVDYRSGRAICIKTFRYEPKHIREFEAGIMLIRHPYRTIISEAYKQRVLKPNIPEAERKALFQSNRWRTFVQREGLRWRNLYIRWLEQSRSSHVVHYDDLVRNPNRTLEEMVRFLNIPVRLDRLECALTRHPPILSVADKARETSPRVYLAESPYTQELESTIMEYIVDVNLTLMTRRKKPFPSNFTVDLY